MIAVSVVDNKNDCFEIFKRHTKFLSDFRLYKDDTITSINDYNKLLTSIEFWEKFEEEKVLIIQHDSGLLRTGIEEFFQYDFIGAPIKHCAFPAMNGGLSLRTPNAMIECIKDTPYNPNIHGNEDIYFCYQLKKLGYNLPSKEISSKFSVETIYALGAMGYHAIDKWLTKEQCETILKQYIE